MEMPRRHIKIEKLFNEALAIDPQHRTDFLLQSCAGDEVLHQEVASLISMHEKPEPFLNRPAYEIASELFSEEHLPAMKGRSFGNYEILGQIGSGGMGEVYKARDLKLGRNVAIKILPGIFSRDQIKLKRLEREARVLAALNHPNIATLHGFEEHEGTCLLVMELISGESLDQRIKRKRMRQPEALEMLRQIASAIEAAHNQGVVHCDLKPANIRLTADGRVKILDFGLARMIEGDRSDPIREVELIIADGAPKALIQGTPPYMSPEQVRGEAFDKRVDIWAFGCLAFEILSSSRAFPGAQPREIAADILNREPDWSKIPCDTHRGIVNLILRCLKKNPHTRLHDIADARIELEDAIASHNLSDRPQSGAETAITGKNDRKSTAYVLWSITILVLVGAELGIWNFWLRKPSTAPVMRFVSMLPQGFTFERTGFAASAIALSPDGSQVVFAARQGNQTQLFQRGIGEIDAKPIPGTENGRAPFFSPDGKRVGFAVQRDVKLVALSGGLPVGGPISSVLPITKADVAFFGADFHPSGDPVYVGECTRGLRSCSFGANGYQKMVLTDVHTDPTYSTQHQFPQVLPGGKDLLFTAWNVPDSEIRVLNLKSGEIKTLVKKAVYGRYLPTGHLVYAWEAKLYAVPFSLETLSVKGPAVEVLDGVLCETARGAAHFSISNNGTLVYIPGGLVNNGLKLAWVDRKGSTEILKDAPQVAVAWISPDGSKIAAARPVAYGSTEIWINEIERGIWRRLTDERGPAFWGAWTPDGRRFVFNSNLLGAPNFELYWKPADGSAREERLTTYSGFQMPGSWTPDGKILAFQQGKTTEPNSYDIWMLPLEGDGKPYPFVASRFGDIHPTFSPDGRWLAYASNDSGNWQVMVRPFPGPGGIIQVSLESSWEPIWSRDGKQIYFRSTDGDRIFGADFSASPAVIIGKPTLVLAGKFLMGTPFGKVWDLASDGKKFLVQIGAEPLPPIDHYNVILNWFDELRRKVPNSN